MEFKAFCQAIQPPREPIESSSIKEWGRVEKTIGSKLPSDYKNYINVFGTGCLANFFWVFNPFTENTNLNLLHQVTAQLDAISVLKEEFDEICPYPIYPALGGLLPWGITDNGNVLFWLTCGEPDLWHVAISSARGSEYEEFEATMTGFLCDLVFGFISSKLVPSELFIQNSAFKVINP